MFSFLVISLLMGSRGLAFSIIDDPCGGSNSVSGTANTVATLKANTTLLAIRDAAKEALHWSTVLVDKYTNPEDKGTTRISNLGPNLPKYIEERRQYGLHNLTQMLEDDFNNVSFMAYYADIAYNNEVNSVESDKFVQEMFEFKSAVNNLLCKIYSVAQTENIEISKKETEWEIASPDNISRRYLLDYIVFCDSQAFLSAMYKYYYGYE